MYSEGDYQKGSQPISGDCHPESFRERRDMGLPEAQTDRFLIALSMGYPDFESELALIKGNRDAGKIERLPAVLDSRT